MKMSEKIYKFIIIIMSITATAFYTLPMMSTYLSDGESCTMFIRGYNIMEFSAWGCIPLLASLLIPVIICGCQTKAAKEVELICLLIGNMVCYTHGIRVSCEWLRSLDGSLLSYYPAIMLYPCLFVVIWMLSWCYNRRNNDPIEFSESEVLPSELSDEL